MEHFIEIAILATHSYGPVWVPIKDAQSAARERAVTDDQARLLQA